MYFSMKLIRGIPLGRINLHSLSKSLVKNLKKRPSQSQINCEKRETFMEILGIISK
jgi:hypothetical protein